MNIKAGNDVQRVHIWMQTVCYESLCLVCFKRLLFGSSLPPVIAGLMSCL